MRRSAQLFALLFFMFLTVTQSAQNIGIGLEIERPKKSRIDKKTITKNTDTLHYKLYYPPVDDKSKKYPLVIYMHGMGSRGNDNEKPSQKICLYFSDSIRKYKYPCFLLVPQCPVSDVWVSFPKFPNSLSASKDPTPSTNLLLELVEDLIKKKNVDANRIYLTGYSMGGEGTFDLLNRAPEVFACGVPVASVADTASAERIKNIPIWAFHGAADQINDVRYTRMMIEAITKKGGRPKFSEFPNVQHDCLKEAYGNPELWEWMFAQNKNSQKK
jgi:predicted peptidase